MSLQNLLKQYSRLQQIKDNHDLFTFEPWQLSSVKENCSASLTDRIDITTTESIQSNQPTRHVALLINDHFPADEHNEILKELISNTGDVRTIYPYVTSGIIVFSYYSLKDAKYCLETMIRNKLVNVFKTSFYVKPCMINKKTNEKLFVVLSTTNEFIDLKQFNYMNYLLPMGEITSISVVNISSNCTIINLEYDDERANEKLVKQLNHAIIEYIYFNVYTDTKNDPCSCSFHQSSALSYKMPWEDRLLFVNKEISSKGNNACCSTNKSYFSTDPFPHHNKPSSSNTNSSFMTSSLLPPSPPLLYQQHKRIPSEEEQEGVVKIKKEDTDNDDSSLTTQDKHNSDKDDDEEEESYSFSNAVMITTTNSTISSSSTTTSSYTKNEIDLDKIMRGEDKRTTFMIRNIPNKYTQQMLIDCINTSHAGTYDFLYLRIDFKNKCNVGYAFINFIDPKTVISFAREKAGKKWQHFNSDKRCALSYANIQGKDALVKKFRNSQVMFEDVAYQPKIFYSDGPNRGKEQAFPVSSDLRNSDNMQQENYVLKNSKHRHLNNNRRRQQHHRRN